MEGPEQIPLILTGSSKTLRKPKWFRPNAFENGRIDIKKKPSKPKIEDEKEKTKKVRIEGSVHINPDEREDDQPRYGR